LLGNITTDRMMLVRYPRMKWDLLGWTVSTQHPLDSTTAFNGSNQSRIGYYDDGWAGDVNHFAFFSAYKPQEMNFTSSDTQYSVFGGEPSTSTSFNMADDQVKIEASKYHQTTLNRWSPDAADAYQAWMNNGDFDEITKKMGYRFRLNNATLPKKLRPGGTFELTMSMVNEGYARIKNPRKVEIILRNQSTGQKYVLDVDNGKGNRLWLPGPGETKTLSVIGGIPTDMPHGNYEVILNLPDPYPSLHDRPEYSIRLANQNVWESSTGYNKLLHTMQIDPSGIGPDYTGSNWFSGGGQSGDTTRYEAENGIHTGTVAYKSAASNGAYIGGLDPYGSGKYSQVTVNVPSAGAYTLDIGYCQGSSNATMSLYVNGSHNQDVTFTKTANWNTFSEKSGIIVNLNSGNNIIKLQTDPGDEIVDVDYFDVTPHAAATRYEAENGIHTGTVAYKSAASNGAYIGGLDPYGSGKYSQVTVNVPSAGAYTLDIGYCQGSSNATMSLYVNGSHNQDVTFTKTANWNTFSEKSGIIVNLNSGNNIIKLQTDPGDEIVDVDYFDIN
jgi:hypothetical protein